MLLVISVQCSCHIRYSEDLIGSRFYKHRTICEKVMFHLRVSTGRIPFVNRPLLKSLTSRSDYCVNSPHNIHSLSTKKVMRITKFL